MTLPDMDFSDLYLAGPRAAYYKLLREPFSVRPVADTDLPGPNGEILHVHVSIGVAAVPTHAKTTVDLIEFADQALYRSKRNGRNQVTLYDSSFEPG